MVLSVVDMMYSKKSVDLPKRAFQLVVCDITLNQLLSLYKTQRC